MFEIKLNTVGAYVLVCIKQHVHSVGTYFTVLSLTDCWDSKNGKHLLLDLLHTIKCIFLNLFVNVIKKSSDYISIYLSNQFNRTK